MKALIFKNSEGQYGPVIPEPFCSWKLFGFGWRAHCFCTRKFKSYEEYQGHYALVHILEYD